MRHATVIVCFLLALGLANAPPALGQTVTQSFDLDEGWNFIWLQVDPTPNDPATVLGSLDYTRLSTFMPGTPAAPDGTWATHYNPDTPAGNLAAMAGNHGYLINMNTPAALTVTGTPALGKRRFSGSSGQLFGITLESLEQVTFNEYFGFAGAHAKITTILRLNGDGFVPVGADDNIISGASYWLFFTSDFTYSGPFRVRVGNEGYAFGDRGYVDEIALEVPVSAQTQSLTIMACPDAAGGDADWLEYLEITPRDGELDLREWKTFGDQGTVFTVPADTSRLSVTIRANRKGRDVAKYMALVKVKNADGFTETIPAGMEVASFYGLYVGQVTLGEVSMTGRNADLASASAMRMALILALPDPATEAGESMKLLGEKTLNLFREGRPITYHYNAILFPKPIDLEGAITGNGMAGTLTGTQEISEDHKLNPYRHRYHPEHGQGFKITREVTLAFLEEDFNPVNRAMGLAESAGNNELNGIYTEKITGLSLYPVTVRGTFKLRRMSHTTDLTKLGSQQ